MNMSREKVSGSMLTAMIFVRKISGNSYFHFYIFFRFHPWQKDIAVIITFERCFEQRIWRQYIHKYVFISSQVIKMSISSVISEISDSLKSPQEPHHHYSGRMHVHMDVSMELDVCVTAFGNKSINEFVVLLWLQLEKLFTLMRTYSGFLGKQVVRI